MISIRTVFWIGAVLLGVAVILFVREQIFLSGSETASGSVVDLAMSSSSSNGGSSFCPVIEFTAADGQNVRYYGNVCTSPPFYNIGDSVDVVYDPQNVHSVQMKNPLSQYLSALIFGLIGAVCAGLGGWFMLPAKKK